MADLTKDKSVPQTLVAHTGGGFVLDMHPEIDIIYKGAFVEQDLTGGIQPANTNSGVTSYFAGIAMEQADNSGGALGDITCQVLCGAAVEYAVTNASVATNGDAVYASDDQTLTLVSTSNLLVGYQVNHVDSTTVIVQLNKPNSPVQKTVEAHTASDTLLGTESGSVHTSVGAAGTITLTLPAALPGMEFFFKVGAAQELRLDPNGTETIALPATGVQGAAGKWLMGNAAGESVHLLCDAAGTWSSYGVGGTAVWTAEA